MIDRNSFYEKGADSLIQAVGWADDRKPDIDMPQSVGLRTSAQATVLLCVFLALLFLPLVVSATDLTAIGMTVEEKAFIKAHPQIVLGTDGNWRPYVIQNPDGSIGGIEAEFFARINALTGLNLQITLGKWTEIQERAKRKEIDGLLAATYQKAREPYFLFSDSPYSTHKYIYTRRADLDLYKDMDSLADKRMAYFRGNLAEENLLKRYPDIVGVAQDNDEELMEALIRGDVDAVVSSFSFQFLLRERMMTEIKLAFTIPDSELKLLYCIRKDWPELKSIINKALAKIPSQQRLEMIELYLGDMSRAQPPRKVDLTPEETAFIKAHPKIVLGADSDWRPYVIPGNDGIVRGIEPELIDRISKMTGLDIELKLGQWSEILEEARQREIDGLAVSAYHEERKEYFLFSDSPYRSNKYIYTKSNLFLPNSMEALSGKSVAYLSGNLFEKKLLAANKKITPVAVEHLANIVQMLLRGDVDAAIGGASFRIFYTERVIDGIGTAFMVPGSEMKLLYSVRKDWPELHSIINKALAEIPLGERIAILERWGGTLPETHKIGLTEKERKWLKAHPVIRLASDDNLTPVESIDAEGRFQGISADFIRLIGQRLDIEFKTSPKKPWSEILEMARNRELDLMTSVMETEERKAFTTFTTPYLSYPIVIITYSSVDYVDGLNGLAGKKVALPKDYAISDLIMREYPELDVELYADALMGMRAVSEGKIFAFLGNIATSSIMMRKHGIGNLKISGETPYRDELGFGVRSDWPELVGILQKALDSITTEEKNAILHKWKLVQVASRIDYRLVWQILGVSLLILLFVLYWNWTLQRARWAALAARKEADAAREAADSANQAKSAFLANMSHELRTPLNAILGFSEMMGRARDIPSTHHEKIGIIKRSGEHLLAMINDVLDLSKIEAGRVELAPEAFNLPRLLEDIGQMFEVRAERAQLRFDLQTDPALAPFIKTDPGKLRQILINLLGNAVKFTREGGFALRSRTLPMVDDSTMVTLQLEVEDSGPGIPTEQQQRIFEPFVQAGHSPTATKGTGLGLAITKSFIKLMGGEIDVKSETDKGSLFRVKLPVALAKTTEEVGFRVTKPAVLGLKPGQPSCRILVVEDNSENRLLLSSLLLQVGFEVREAENGEEALAIFKQWEPHFIWMDMRMPVMDGYKATAKIRSLGGGDEVKIVAITASAFKEQRKTILEAGCDDVVHKPFREQEIFETMEKHLGVKFLYKEEDTLKKEEEAVKLSHEMLDSLSDEFRRELRQAALEGDGGKARELADSISESHPKTAQAILKLANEFRLDTLLNFLD